MDWLILRDALKTACNIMSAIHKKVDGWERVGRVGVLMMPVDTADQVCAHWARQMATAALTIPRGEQTLSGTVWNHRLPY